MSFQLDLTAMPRIMGILNTTPDSFSDGGSYNQLDAAIIHTRDMIEAGADIIDVGGESTRPGAAPVSAQQEIDRTAPVIEKICQEFDIDVSIDSSKPDVMQAAVNVGARMINDVRALQMPGALAVAAQANVDVCLMHMQGQPESMQDNPSYGDLYADIIRFFKQRMRACSDAGICLDKVYLDPGFGFGKTLEHNYQLLANLSVFKELDRPLLVGLSRKSMIGTLLERDTEQRLAGSLAGAILCALQGASIIRVHDVKETVDCMKVLNKTLSVN